MLYRYKWDINVISIPKFKIHRWIIPINISFAKKKNALPSLLSRLASIVIWRFLQESSVIASMGTQIFLYTCHIVYHSINHVNWIVYLDHPQISPNKNYTYSHNNKVQNIIVTDGNISMEHDFYDEMDQSEYRSNYQFPNMSPQK